MIARDDIRAPLPAVRARTGSDTFTAQDVIYELGRRGTSYSVSTIRTHVTSRLCANAPDNHGQVYSDLERVERGRYQARSQ